MKVSIHFTRQARFNMDNLDAFQFAEFMTGQMKKAAREAVREIIEPLELFPELPPVATTPEVAAALLVSDEVLIRMAKNGMPHVHAGRELRFAKPLLINWSITGQIYYCEVCSGEKMPLENDRKKTPEEIKSPKVVGITSGANSKLAKLARSK